MSAKPLSGLKVLELTNVLAGPFCGQQLAHLGADIIKVEPRKGGDLARQLGAEEPLNAEGMGVSYLAQNAGKRSLTLDLKTKAGQDVYQRLIKTADVLIENFRPGVMQRLGLGYETLRTMRPELVYCAISGFGQDGPWAQRPAYDQIVQGVAGVMSVTGHPGQSPTRVGYPLADTIGGLTAAFAICAALQARPRGSFIDVSMLDSVLATMGWVISNHLIAGVDPAPQGNENPTSAPSGTFQAADGLLNIAANKTEQWSVLAKYLGRDDLLTNSDFATREDRKTNRLRLKAELETVLTTKSAQLWAEELNRIGVPAGPVLSVPQILTHPQITERGLFQNFTGVGADARDVTVIGPGLQLDHIRPLAGQPPPTLGENTDAILRDIGYSDTDIADLRAGNII